MNVRHFLRDDDLSPAELLEVLDLADAFHASLLRLPCLGRSWAYAREGVNYPQVRPCDWSLLRSASPTTRTGALS